MSLRSFLGKAAALALLAQQVAADCDTDPNPCVSYGVDFQDGGSYFQNSLSSDPFTFVSQFEGCTNDTAFNFLIDPQGDQDTCSNTNLTPDDSNQLATCPDYTKNEMYSGDWSVVLISNNGNACPLGVERDFYLSVGPQQTTTYTPTVYVTTTTTPLTSTTTTTTYTVVSTAPVLTTTVASTTITPTVRVTPRKVTTTTTSVLATITKIVPKVSVVKTTEYITPSCHLPIVATSTDKSATISITVTNDPTATAAKPRARFNRRADGSVELLNKEEFVKERRAYLSAHHQLAKRAPDAETITVTDTNTTDYVTSTITSTDSTVTATFANTVTTTSTTTPSPIVVIQGKLTALRVTTTLPTPTRTIVRFEVLSTTVSTTYYETITIRRKTTPATLKSACKTAGGVLF